LIKDTSAFDGTALKKNSQKDRITGKKYFHGNRDKDTQSTWNVTASTVNEAGLYLISLKNMNVNY
jgi:hypothetical protein